MPNLNGKVLHEYQARFGSAPTTQDPNTEVQRWQELCQAILEDREQARRELSKTQEALSEYRKMITALLPPIDDETKRLSELPLEELLAMSSGQSLQDLIAELARADAGSPNG